MRHPIQFIGAAHRDLSDTYGCHATITRVHFSIGSLFIEAVRFFRSDNGQPSADVKIELWTSVPLCTHDAPELWRYLDPREPVSAYDRTIVEAVEVACGLRLPPEPRPIEM
jgi:hypothetical protein